MRINYLLIVLLANLTFFSCTDLETKLTDSELGEEAGEFKPFDDLTAPLESSYKDLGRYTDQANIYALGQHTSDEMIPPTRGVDWGDNGVWRTLHAHNWDATHSMVRDAWNQLHENTFRTNTLVASAANGTAQQNAEARFLRAFNMHYAMDYYGQVPFREVTEGPDVDPRVLTRAEAWQFIVDDLNAALPDLPSLGPSVDNSILASKAAAHFLLAKLHLNAGVYKASDATGPYDFSADDMNKVVEHVDAIEAEGFALNDDFFGVFTNAGNSEVIFASNEGTPQNRWMMTLHYDQNPSGWNGFATLADVYDRFEENDSRIGQDPLLDGTEFSGIGKGFLIGQQFKEDGTELIDSRSQQPLQFTPDVPLAGAATAKGIRVVKYHPADAGKYILMRYADAFLMKVEALHRGASGGDALALLNDLRMSRGASQLSSIDDATILDERSRELYWEGGRRTDQIRFGTFDEEWSFKTVTDPTRVLFPIPAQALASNPNLTQNPGY